MTVVYFWVLVSWGFGQPHGGLIMGQYETRDACKTEQPQWDTLREAHVYAECISICQLPEFRASH